MNEEEKKAIKYIKEFKNETKERVGNKSTMVKNLNILLNLIDKQKKEIEDMREELQMYVDTNIEENFDMVYMKAVADFKDKIRKIIKEVSNGTYDAKIILEQLLEE